MLASRVPSIASRRSVTVRAATAIPDQFKTVTPLGERVLVRIGKSDDVSAGGILLPSTAQKKPTAGDVVSPGSAKHVKSGDRVVYSKFAGTEVELAGVEHVLLKEEDCIGVTTGAGGVHDMKPLGDRLLIQTMDAATKTSGGIILSANAGGGEKPTVGKVLATGQGKMEGEKMVPVGVAVGSTVLYQKFTGTEFEENDKIYVVIREADVLAVLN